MTIIDSHDPFPGSETIALEVTPSGPYATFRKPWSVEAIPDQPAIFGGLLGSGAVPYRDAPIVAGVRFRAYVVRMSYRWTLAPMGPVYLRGFNQDGKRLWTGSFRAIEPVDLEGVYDDGVVASLDLLAPFTVVEHA